MHMHAGCGFHGRPQTIGKLDERRVGREARKRLAQQCAAAMRLLVQQRQARHDRRKQFCRAECRWQVVGIADDDFHPGKTRGGCGCKLAVEFNQGETRWINAAGQQSLGHNACAGSQFENTPGCGRVDLCGHRARERRTRRCDGTHMPRFGGQPAEELPLIQNDAAKWRHARGPSKTTAHNGPSRSGTRMLPV